VTETVEIVEDVDEDQQIQEEVRCSVQFQGLIVDGI
jgi:hypothetical protein